MVRRSRVTQDLDTTFGLLRSPRRRYILYYLYESEEQVTKCGAVVDAVCEYEALGKQKETFPPREEIMTDLHHNHLPRLDAANVLEYDDRQQTIRFQGGTPLEEWLEHARYIELD